MEHHLRLLAAVAFAAEKHRNQCRKDGSAFVNHVIAVARVLAEEGGVEDSDLLIAALLHDTLEDTDTSAQELEELFGSAVAGIVAEVSDDTGLASAERKRLQAERAAWLSPQAKQLRMADKICNVRDIIESPPSGWSPERRVGYILWTRRVTSGCRGVNARLDEICDRAVEEAFHWLEHYSE
ncbi:MAG TPA: HD domain-containing protein [Verrucomicrobiae bacterium]|nr:HD domain-containing protein [Verrucomicrobiae bacterium]